MNKYELPSYNTLAVFAFTLAAALLFLGDGPTQEKDIFYAAWFLALAFYLKLCAIEVNTRK